MIRMIIYLTDEIKKNVDNLIYVIYVPIYCISVLLRDKNL